MKQIILIVIIALIISLCVQYFLQSNNQTQSIVTETAYQRVMRTGTLRCGYDVWPPIIIEDSKDGKLSGIFFDYATSLANNLGLKIEWVKGSYGDYIAGLDYGRYDAFCAGLWPLGEVIRAADFTKPIYYNLIGIYVRAGDNRFDNAPEKINHPNIRIAAIDGLIPSRIAKNDFPQAQIVTLPQTSPTTDMLLSVATGKADVTFTDKITAETFMSANPNSLQQVPVNPPIRVFGNTIAVAKNQEALLSMLNQATDELLQAGIIEKILKQYENPDQGRIMLVRPPY